MNFLEKGLAAENVGNNTLLSLSENKKKKCCFVFFHFCSSTRPFHCPRKATFDDHCLSWVTLSFFFISKTRLFKYVENFNSKSWKFSEENSDIFHISSQNIDCGYPLEPPRRGGSNEYPQSMFWAEIRKIMYTPVNLSFTIQKRGL